MHRLIRSTLLAATLVALGPSQALAADADGYPQGPISYVVPAPPGGLIDTMARTVAETMGRELKQPVVIENKPGGNTNIGIAYVARAKPDGLTWLAVSSTLAVNATLFKQLPFDPEKDLIPVALFATTPMGMAVPANSPYNNVQDIIKAAKAGKVLNVGSSGFGTPPHLALVLFQRLTGAKFNHIPYKGGAPSLNDLVGGQLDLIFTTLSESRSFIHAGRLKLLAVSSSERVKEFPSVPTTGEQGLPDMLIAGWTGLMMPAGTPAPIVDGISARLVAEVAKPAMKQKLEDMGYVVAPQDHAQFTRFYRDEIRKWGDVIIQENIERM